MGMFDRVLVKCPKCGATYKGQTKDGACDLGTYGPERVPFGLVDFYKKTFACPCGACFTHEPDRISRDMVVIEAVTAEPPSEFALEYGSAFRLDSDGYPYFEPLPEPTQPQGKGG